MKIWQLIEHLKKFPPHQIAIVPHEYNYGKVETIKEIEVETDSDTSPYGGDLTEYKTGNPRIKAVLIK